MFKIKPKQILFGLRQATLNFFYFTVNLGFNCSSRMVFKDFIVVYGTVRLW